MAGLSPVPAHRADVDKAAWATLFADLGAAAAAAASAEASLSSRPSVAARGPPSAAGRMGARLLGKQRSRSEALATAVSPAVLQRAPVLRRASVARSRSMRSYERGLEAGRCSALRARSDRPRNFVTRVLATGHFENRVAFLEAAW